LPWVSGFIGEVLPPAEVDPEFELPAVLGINRT